MKWLVIFVLLIIVVLYICGCCTTGLSENTEWNVVTKQIPNGIIGKVFVSTNSYSIVVVNEGGTYNIKSKDVIKMEQIAK